MNVVKGQLVEIISGNEVGLRGYVDSVRDTIITITGNMKNGNPYRYREQISVAHGDYQILHQIVLGYTTDDDGIHVQCSCGWSKNLGFDATPEMALEAANQHRAEVG